MIKKSWYHKTKKGDNNIHTVDENTTCEYAELSIYKQYFDYKDDDELIDLICNDLYEYINVIKKAKTEAELVKTRIKEKEK